MWRSLMLLLVGCCSVASPAAGAVIDSNIWINEFHYDNTGSDVREFIEVIAPTSFTQLDQISLTTYNGSDGGPYGATHLLTEFTRTASSSGFDIYLLEFASSRFQNGAPDGLALADAGGVLQFISYEGSFTATAGPAMGLTSTNIVVSEASDTPVGFSLQLTGSGNSYGDFSWTGPLSDTRGAWNTGQSGTAAVPEPSTWVLALLALAALPIIGAPRLVRDGRLAWNFADAKLNHLRHACRAILPPFDGKSTYPDQALVEALYAVAIDAGAVPAPGPLPLGFNTRGRLASVPWTRGPGPRTGGR